ncbi:MAG TPA: hypothetical protein DC024_08870 [Clostridiales bacterium]|jgi:radical SAM protein with 4Fe4S-binding SPASM domain|nr:hypothetical protein [Clostridiales bacterium]HCS10427.1 hypothetical protein [Clostridiales bacterium]
MERYTVRHEFFGGLVYDRNQDANILIDDEFYELLNYLKKTNEKDISHILNLEDIDFLKQEKFLSDNKLNYRMVDSGFKENTLSAPGRVHFYYTSKCNLNCTHCFTKNSDVKREMTFSEKISMLDQMYELGVNEILIGGGEPFIQSDFPDFVEECLKRNIITKVFTNGLLLNDKKLVERMSKWSIKYLSISIDGADEEEYEKVRGIKGLQKIKENLKYLKENCDFTIAASITVNPYNYYNTKKILELIADFGFDRLKVRPVKPAGNVLKNKDIFLTAEQYASFIKNTQKIWNRQYKEMFTLDFSWGDTRLVYNKDKNQVEPLDITYPYEGYGCFAGKVNIVFDSGGNALTCGFLPDDLSKNNEDNLQFKSLKEIWETGQKFESLRNVKGNKVCENCKYYSVCRGGCMARNLFINRDINLPDPWCLNKYLPIKIDFT